MSGVRQASGSVPALVDLPGLLDPADVQRALKLSSRRGARELIVREMEHVVVGRTPMTTAEWLSEWLERQRRGPRRRVPSANSSVVATSQPPRSNSRSRPGMPAPRSRVRSS
jgi:hypothetical protein